MFLKQYFNLWFPVVLWCAVIFILSSIPTLPAPEILWWDFILKKSAHIIEYAILYYLVYRAITKEFRIKNLELRIKERKIKIPYVLCSMFLVLLYAFSDEYHQSFVPGRHAKLMDVGFDSLGMLISYWRIKS